MVFMKSSTMNVVAAANVDRMPLGDEKQGSRSKRLLAASRLTRRLRNDEYSSEGTLERLIEKGILGSEKNHNRHSQYI